MNRVLEIIYLLFFSFVRKTRLNKLSYKLVDLKNWFLNLPTSVPIVLRRTWRGRERAIAVIAGVF